MDKNYLKTIEQIKELIWDAIIKRMSQGNKNRHFIDYNKYSKKIDDIFNSIEVIALDIEDDIKESV